MRWNRQMGLALLLLGVLALLAMGSAYIREARAREKDQNKVAETEAVETENFFMETEEKAPAQSFRQARGRLRGKMMDQLLQCVQNTLEPDLVVQAEAELLRVQKEMEVEFAMERMLEAQGWQEAGVFCWAGGAFVTVEEELSAEDALWIQHLAMEIGNYAPESVHISAQTPQ